MRMPGWIKNDLGLKFLALALAVVLWIYTSQVVTVTGERPLGAQIKIPVPPGLKLLGQDGRMTDAVVVPVQIIVRGQQQDIDRLIDRLAGKPLLVRVDPSEIKDQPGTQTIIFKRAHLRGLLPSTVSDLHFEPDRYEIHVVKAVSRKHRVRVDRNEPPLGYEVDKEHVDPLRVQITLPGEDAAREIPPNLPVSTRPVKIPQHQGEGSLSLKVELLDHFTWKDRKYFFTTDTRTVRVDLVIIPRSKKPLTVRNIPILVLRPPGFRSEVTLEPDTINVRLMGRGDVLDRLVVQPEKIRAYVDLSRRPDEGSGRYEKLPVVMNLPPGIEFAQDSAKLMTSAVLRPKGAAAAPRTERRRLEGLPLRVLPPPGFTGRFELEVRTVDVELEGTAKALQAIQAARDVCVFANLPEQAARVEAGSFTPPVLVLVIPKNGVVAVSVTPARVRVKVTRGK